MFCFVHTSIFFPVHPVPPERESVRRRVGPTEERCRVRGVADNTATGHQGKVQS